MDSHYVSMEENARMSIKASLAECTEKERNTFMRTFSPFNKSLTLEQVVDNLEDHELNNVMQLLAHPG